MTPFDTLAQLGQLMLFPAVGYLIILERRLTKLETMLSILLNRRRITDLEEEA